MKIHPVGAELFFVDGRMEGQTDRYDEGNNCFFAILLTHLKTGNARAISN
jgi:hypothetical protein